MLMLKSIIVLVSLSTFQSQTYSSRGTFPDMEACRAATAAGVETFKAQVGDGILVLGECYEAAREGDPS